MRRAICRIATATTNNKACQTPCNHCSPIHLQHAPRRSRTGAGHSAQATATTRRARATDDYAPADAASNVVDEDAPAPLLDAEAAGHQQEGAAAQREAEEEARCTMGTIMSNTWTTSGRRGMEDVSCVRRGRRCRA